ncbi:hypothetical protein SAMN05660860_02320 [Geoalkalibacter ferrihydriticus]|uniref:Lipoprotein n=2 Tax=Geoalkalibacter ferrihydriticus TaxID=392333 RepID=A0A0C2HZ35_9BACT|nr:hypothetical protein [Geoalkalibacter ferrihydriticus]KIH78012.1 hypothetical protein GFER_05280 [Geoalkalibacter ferrihydriticus DSM 17813]SDM33097.1 hypothetical protein SAMN05660860_02320 [Geoalkalibacter ferrihydriticus]
MNIKSLCLVLAALVGLFWIAGCGTSSNRGAAQDGVILMQLNEEYEVYEGDVLEPTDEDTRIVVRHVFEDDKKYVTLLAGSATLVFGGGLQK